MKKYMWPALLHRAATNDE